MAVKFCEFDENYLELSYVWLNDEENRFLTNTKEISRQKQKDWFDSLPGKTDYRIWGVSFDSVPVGAAGLKAMSKDTAYVFWYIGEKEFWGKGIGEKIARIVSLESKKFGLKSLFAESIFENFRSINLLFKVGYKIVSYENGLYTLRIDLS